MKKLTILYVEDDSSDIDLAKTVLELSGLAKNVELVAVESGEAAMDYLNRRPPYESASIASFVLLDLNIPGSSGRDILREIKSSPRLRTLPVVMFSTTGSQAEIDLAYASGASMFLTKPMNLSGLKALFNALFGLWGGYNRFPSVTMEEPKTYVVADPTQEEQGAKQNALAVSGDLSP